jgi:hypothetical protein
MHGFGFIVARDFPPELKKKQPEPLFLYMEQQAGLSAVTF